MCGLAGLWRFGSPITGSAELASALDAALAHRGPDAGGSFLSPSSDLLLVHRRLAIIDPGPDAAQPMASADGRFRLLFNGEIYNYPALRADLSGQGESFRTRSDTEVLLRWLMTEGPPGLARLRGMFAVALWDGRDRRLYLARDRFGIKPLYVTSTGRQMAFASEIGALRRAGLTRAGVSPAGVLAYLSWASVPPPLTWVDGVEAVRPGTCQTWSADGHREVYCFADVRDRYVTSTGPRVREPELCERIGVAVRSSVERHMEADVPVGVFLSGGLDSSAIVSSLGAGGHGGVRTFTVTAGDTGWSEAPFAREVSRAFELPHDEIRVDVSSVRRDLPEILSRLDQPTADGVNTFYVARAVASTGLKAVLSGTGGDELFGGYPSFRRVPKGLAAGRRLGPTLVAAGRVVEPWLPSWRRAKWRHACTAGADISALYRAERGLFMPAEIARMAGPALVDPAVRRRAQEALTAVETEVLGAVGPESVRASVARLETRLYLGAQLLRDIDAMSMAHGLEVRLPFVDHELHASVWPGLGDHARLMANKRVLRESLARRLPTAIVRRPKHGFHLPFEQWLGRDLSDPIRDGLQRLVADGWLRPEVPGSLWRSWEAGETHWSRVWALGILGQFLPTST
jgi:asparagine synthase (glutamine-hydrolysing)